jgi:hypothetical protein
MCDPLRCHQTRRGRAPVDCRESAFDRARIDCCPPNRPFRWFEQLRRFAPRRTLRIRHVVLKPQRLSRSRPPKMAIVLLRLNAVTGFLIAQRTRLPDHASCPEAAGSAKPTAILISRLFVYDRLLKRSLRYKTQLVTFLDQLASPLNLSSKVRGSPMP